MNGSTSVARAARLCGHTAPPRTTGLERGARKGAGRQVFRAGRENLVPPPRQSQVSCCYLLTLRWGGGTEEGGRYLFAARRAGRVPGSRSSTPARAHATIAAATR